eukprot:2268909-Rhodomonas_salina.3
MQVLTWRYGGILGHYAPHPRDPPSVCMGQGGLRYPPARGMQCPVLTAHVTLPEYEVASLLRATPRKTFDAGVPRSLSAYEMLNTDLGYILLPGLPHVGVDFI